MIRWESLWPFRAPPDPDPSVGLAPVPGPDTHEAEDRRYGVLFVCTGNICRSPTAEVVLRRKLEEAGLADRVRVASAGTHGTWHAEQPPDARAIAHALRRGYDLSPLRARALVPADFERHDLILAMDEDNFAILARRCDPSLHARLGRLAAHGKRFAEAEIADPYFGPPAGFDRVLDLIEDSCDGVLEYLRSRLPQA